MKIKALYMILFGILLASACSPGKDVTDQTAGAISTQMEEISPTEVQDGQSSQPSKKNPRLGQSSEGRTLPQEAIDACNGKK